MYVYMCLCVCVKIQLCDLDDRKVVWGIFL